MFRGVSEVNLDTKGRIAVPTRYREQLKGAKQKTLVATIDTEYPCLWLYPMHAWEVIEEKLQALPSFNAAARRVQRLLIGHATELDIDAQGRLLLPNVLREYGKFEKKIMLVGQGKKFELWDADTWRSHREMWLLETAKSQETLPESLADICL